MDGKVNVNMDGRENRVTDIKTWQIVAEKKGNSSEGEAASAKQIWRTNMKEKEVSTGEGRSGKIGVKEENIKEPKRSERRRENWEEMEKKEAAR